MRLSKTVRAAICLSALTFAALPLAAGASQTLPHHVPPAVGASRRLGPLSSMARLDLAVGLPLRHREELDRFVQDISDRQSANYRRYLSSSQFAERFGPTQSDYDRLAAFFQANGFTVSGTHSNRMILDVMGPVSAIENTLHVRMALWEHPTRGRYFAPDRDPSLDVDVAVLDIAGLDNYILPRPMDLKRRSPSAPAPMVTGSGPAGMFIGNDFRAAYAPGVTLTGAGQTVGLFELDGFFPADVASNFQQAGLPPVPVSTVLLDGSNGAPGGENIEVILDIVMAGYMAPGSSVLVYEGFAPNDVLNRMATDNFAKQLSCSWVFSPINSTTEQVFTEMIAQGQSFLQAAGDSGAYYGPIWPPADDPNVTSVGGTSLTTAAPGGPWYSETTWSDGGGGVSTDYPIPSYQQAINMASLGGSNTMRNIPDVASVADIQISLIYNDGAWTEVGGTSAAAPLWAGFIALANQQAAANGNPAVGFLNPTLYSIGLGSDYASDLHDIATGSNGFAALSGYDLATGWGTPAGQPLINDLSATPGVPSFGLSADPSSLSAHPGAGTSSTIHITSHNGFSGAVTLSVLGLPSGVTGAVGPVSKGVAQLTLTLSGAAAPGSYAFSVHGVSGNVTATASLNLQVTAGSSFSLTATPAAVNLAQGGAANSSIAVISALGFSGTVNLVVTGLPNGVSASFSPAVTATTSSLTFLASANATAGAAAVTVTGTSGSLTATAAIALTIVPPALFSISAAPAAVSVTKGASATSIVTVTPKSGFTGKVTLTASGLPAGVTASFSTLSTSSTITFVAASSAAPATSTVTVTGTSGASSTSAAIALTVKAGPSFTLGAAPASLVFSRGTSTTATVTVTPVSGFNGAVNLAVAGLPPGVSASFSPTSTASSSKLTLTAGASASVGAATATITGTSGSTSATATVSVTVAASSGFTLSSSTVNVTIAAGGSGKATLSVVPAGGFNGSVALVATGLPTGITASFSPATATAAAASTLTLTAAASKTPGASQFTIKGTSGSFSETLAMTVTVTAGSDFTLAAVPATLSLAQGAQGSSAISITPVNGFTGTVKLAASGLPGGVTASFGSMISGSILATFTASASAPAGTSKVTLTGTSGSLTHTTVLTLTVTALAAGSAAVNLASYYNVPAIAVDYAPFTSGGLDAGGRSYSGTLLGAGQTISGTVFTFGPMGASDAVSGQTVTLPGGKFTTLNLLASGVNGSQAAQTFTVTYTDGTSTSFTQSLSDWCVPQSFAGESKAVPMSYRDNSIGTIDTRPIYLYGYSFTLNSSKTVSSIALPRNRNVVVMAISLSGGAKVAQTPKSR